MKPYSLLIVVLTIGACTSPQPNKKEDVSSKAIQQHDSTDGENDEAYFKEVDTFYIVVADTGTSYYSLHTQMLKLNQRFHLPIDTMGRFYNQTKDLIMLPENDEDEVYRGDYFPRRFPSTNLSLEYLLVYNSNSTDKTIALVTGIFENQQSADSAKQVILKVQPTAFVLKSGIYTGCMH